MVCRRSCAKSGIKAGDKLAVATWKKDGMVCCISLIKAGNLAGKSGVKRELRIGIPLYVAAAAASAVLMMMFMLGEWRVL